MNIRQIRKWVDAARADGWKVRPTYKSEAISRAATLDHPDGWTAMALMRSDHQSHLAVWGPDKLVVSPPESYDLEALKAQLTICQECGAEGKTVRLGFANRVCPDCRKKLAPKVEHRGWTS